MEYDLSRITKVSRSGWDGSLFLNENETPNGEFHLCDYLPDQPLYDLIMQLIENWPSEEILDGGAIVYRRPENG